MDIACVLKLRFEGMKSIVDASMISFVLLRLVIFIFVDPSSPDSSDRVTRKRETANLTAFAELQR